jgi:hypothetical protein
MVNSEATETIKITVMENLEVNCILGMLAAIQFSIFQFHAMAGYYKPLFHERWEFE